jgi:hypothetical protein
LAVLAESALSADRRLTSRGNTAARAAFRSSELLKRAACRAAYRHIALRDRMNAARTSEGVGEGRSSRLPRIPEDVMRVASILLIAGAMLLAERAYARDIDWEKIDSAFGRKAVVSADVHRNAPT